MHHMKLLSVSRAVPIESAYIKHKPYVEISMRHTDLVHPAMTAVDEARRNIFPNYNSYFVGGKETVIAHTNAKY